MTHESQNTSMYEQVNSEEDQEQLHLLVEDSPMSTIKIILVMMCIINNLIDGMDIH